VGKGAKRRAHVMQGKKDVGTLRFAHPTKSTDRHRKGPAAMQPVPVRLDNRTTQYSFGGLIGGILMLLSRNSLV
jgi:hypothetical protein